MGVRPLIGSASRVIVNDAGKLNRKISSGLIFDLPIVLTSQVTVDVAGVNLSAT
ncbi:MAG: hypothetical protein WBH73_01985 [Arcanobacterium sp.]